MTVDQAKQREWMERAKKKNAIVPLYFEVFTTKVILECGACGFHFQRPLVPNLNEPVFVCPQKECRARNWVPLKYQRGV